MVAGGGWGGGELLDLVVFYFIPRVRWFRFVLVLFLILVFTPADTNTFGLAPGELGGGGEGHTNFMLAVAETTSHCAPKTKY